MAKSLIATSVADAYKPHQIKKLQQWLNNNHDAAIAQATLSTIRPTGDKKRQIFAANIAKTGQLNLQSLPRQL
jgi:hypothetical protein